MVCGSHGFSSDVLMYDLFNGHNTVPSDPETALLDKHVKRSKNSHWLAQ